MTIKELYDMVLQKIPSHIKCINKFNKPVFVVSDSYPGIWLEHLYDSIMYGMLFNDYSIALNTFDIFIECQLESGQLPYSIKADSIGYSQTQECVSFAGLGLLLYNITNDKEFLRKVYDSSISWATWLENNRMTLNLGLPEIFVGYDTGHDNSPRLNHLTNKGSYYIDGVKQNANIKPDDNILIGVDMTSNLIKTYDSISEMAMILNDSININKYSFKAMNLKNKMMEYLYDESSNFFYDIDQNKNKILIKSSTILHLYLENVLKVGYDDKLIDSIYNNHIKNPNEFWCNYPFPSISISEAPNIMDNSWGYYSQALIALRCSLWMDDYGYSKDYDYILSKWVEGFVNNYDKYPFSQELDPNSGIGSNGSIWYSSAMLLFIYATRRLKLI